MCYVVLTLHLRMYNKGGKITGDSVNISHSFILLLISGVSFTTFLTINLVRQMDVFFFFFMGETLSPLQLGYLTALLSLSRFGKIPL